MTGWKLGAAKGAGIALALNIVLALLAWPQGTEPQIYPVMLLIGAVIGGIAWRG